MDEEVAVNLVSGRPSEQDAPGPVCDVVSIYAVVIGRIGESDAHTVVRYVVPADDVIGRTVKRDAKKLVFCYVVRDDTVPRRFRELDAIVEALDMHVLNDHVYSSTQVHSYGQIDPRSMKREPCPVNHYVIPQHYNRPIDAAHKSVSDVVGA